MLDEEKEPKKQCHQELKNKINTSIVVPFGPVPEGAPRL
jgi:hypothetical protein